MSMHKIPLTILEEEGLRKYGLRIGTASQLSDAFRLGMKWSEDNRALPLQVVAQKPISESKVFIKSDTSKDWAELSDVHNIATADLVLGVEALHKENEQLKLVIKRKEIVNNTLAEREVLLKDENEALRKENEQLRKYKEAFDEWMDKTKWVQDTILPKELGMHRADILLERIKFLIRDNDHLRGQLWTLKGGAA